MKRIILMMVILALSLVQTGCGCSFGKSKLQVYAGLYKYRDDMDLSEYIWAHQSDLKGRYITEQWVPRKPIAVANGYYLGEIIQNTRDIVYVTKRIDEVQSESMHHEWITHWEDYDTIQHPFVECYIIHVDKCYGDFPAERPGCSSTFGIDTIVLNQMIRNGEINDYIRWLSTY